MSDETKNRFGPHNLAKIDLQKSGCVWFGLDGIGLVWFGMDWIGLDSTGGVVLFHCT